MEYVTADLLQFFTEIRQNVGYGGRLGTRHETQAFQRFS